MLRRRDVLKFSSAALTATIAGCSVPSLGDGSGSGADEEAGVIWDRRYKGERATKFVDIVPASTGGFLLIGSTVSDTDVLGQGFAIRTDDEGSEQWRHTVSGTSALLAATQGATGEFVAATYRAGAGGTGDSGAVALTDDGTERWQTPLSQSGQSQLRTVVQASDGNFALGGVDREAGWLVRLGPDGSVRTNRRPVLESVPLRDVIGLHPGASGLTVLAAGGTEGTVGDWRALFQLAPDGSVAWGRRYNTTFSDIVVTDDGYALLGQEFRSPPRLQLVLVSADGSVTDRWLYGPPDGVHRFTEQALVRASDGGFIIGGRYLPTGEVGTRRGSIVMQTSPGADSVAWTRLYEDGEEVWALARADDHSVFTDTVNEARQARLVRFGQPRMSNVTLEAAAVSGPTSQPL